MSTETSNVFTKDNIDLYLKELSKEYKRLGGRNVPVELILIGGAAIIESYGFREMTTDIDAVLPAVSIMKDAINRVGDKYGLPSGWLNADFIGTDSYSPRLNQYSVPYKTFNQVLNVRTLTGEYLIAMKLRSGRKYKNDLSDIVGILAEHEAMKKPICYEDVDTAVANLYGGWEHFSEDSLSFIRSLFETGNYREMYSQIRENEVQAKEILLDFQKAYPSAIKAENINCILEAKAEQQNRASVLAKLQGKEGQQVEDVRPLRKAHKNIEER